MGAGECLGEQVGGEGGLVGGVWRGHGAWGVLACFGDVATGEIGEAGWGE